MQSLLNIEQTKLTDKKKNQEFKQIAEALNQDLKNKDKEIRRLAKLERESSQKIKESEELKKQIQKFQEQMSSQRIQQVEVENSNQELQCLYNEAKEYIMNLEKQNSKKIAENEQLQLMCGGINKIQQEVQNLELDENELTCQFLSSDLAKILKETILSLQNIFDEIIEGTMKSEEDKQTCLMCLQDALEIFAREMKESFFKILKQKQQEKLYIQFLTSLQNQLEDSFGKNDPIVKKSNKTIRQFLLNSIISNTQ